MVPAVVPFPLLDVDLKLEGLDAILNLIAGAVEPLIQDRGCRFGDGLAGKGVVDKGRLADEPVDLALNRVRDHRGGQPANAELRQGRG